MNSRIITRIKFGGVFLLSSILLLYPVSYFVHVGIYIIIFCIILYNKALWSYLAFVKPLSFALLILVLIQMFTFEGIGMSIAGLFLGIMSAFRILSLSSIVFIFVKTTYIRDFLKALDFLPLSIRFSLSIGFGMMSILSTELHKIKIALEARGHKTNWNIVKTYSPLIIPLITKSFIRAQKMALSLQARGYRG